MKLLRFFFPAYVFALLFVVSATAHATEGDLKITEMAVTTKIVRGNPIDSVHRISSTSVKALYCFTRLQSATGEKTTIRHIWYRDNEKVGEYELPVRDKRWRTYSKKMIEKGSSGDWRVEALDSAGHLLKTVKFRMN
ncbi:MAG TPA: DUF2914 domain-containing protein [Geobacteraceae bacterium]|nr:DUF2914 domain-containing protein [Geobacteraceae bacterium]